MKAGGYQSAAPIEIVSNRRRVERVLRPSQVQEWKTMGWQFRKSKSLLGRLIRLTFGRRGFAISTGVRGFRVSRSPGAKLTRTVGIPGTGLYWRDLLRKKRRRPGR